MRKELNARFTTRSVSSIIHARALARSVLVTRPPRQMTIIMSTNIWDTHHHGHDALST